MKLDHKDRRIVDELLADARLTMAELGRRVGLSQPAVAERVEKLEAAKVIRGYHAHVDAAALGLGVRAIVRVGRVDWERMHRLIESLPEVTDALNVTGEDSWVLMVAVRDVAHLDELLGSIGELGEPATSIVLRPLREQGITRED